MHRFLAATGRFAVRFRWAIVVAWVAATVLANLLFPSLTSVARQNNTSSLLVPSTAALLARWNWWPSMRGRLVDPAPDLTVTPVGVR